MLLDVIGKIKEDLTEFVEKYDGSTNKCTIYTDTLDEYNEGVIDYEELIDELYSIEVKGVRVDDSWVNGDEFIVQLDNADLEDYLEQQRIRERAENKRIEDEYWGGRM